ncbi:MAG: MATE family efflux transporter [Clostridia bacterium]|nr:MATE family efflux transporter [Clostridia bacterium]
MSKNTSHTLLTEGNLVARVITFAIPVMLTNMLQMFLTTIDNVVIGQFCGSNDLGAMGCASPVVSLIINILLGISTGTAVCTAQAMGSGNKKDIYEIVHTSMATAVACGVIFGIIGIGIAEQSLVWMACPSEMLSGATTYLRIYFLGMPFTMIYNFGAAILRATGDTKRPLYYMIAAGAVNVCFNLFFVLVCGLGIAGVAIGTIVSQLIAAILVCRYLVKTNEVFRLEIKKIKIYPKKLARILRVGIPSGLQSSVYCVSNIVIQSSVNSLGAAVVTGASAQGNYEAFVSVAMTSFAQTAITFVAQHMGAKKYKRMNRCILVCICAVSVISLSLNGLMWLFRDPLLRVFIVDNEAALKEAVLRMSVICPFHIFCGILDVVSGSVQGLGASVSSTSVSLAGTCGLRLLWVATVFKNATENRALTLFAIYPISWICSLIAMIILFFIMRHRIIKRNGPEEPLEPTKN